MFRMIPLLALAGCLLPLNTVRAQEEDTDSAIINIRVPADAVVWVNGKQKSSGGYSTVEFETKQLEFGQTYSYDIKAQVYRNGEWITDRVTATVQAGKVYSVYPDLNPRQAYGNDLTYGSGYAQGGGYQGGYSQGGYVGGFQGGGFQGGGFQGGSFQGGGFGGGVGMGTQPSGRPQGAYALDKYGHPVYLNPGQHLNQYNQQNYGGFPTSHGIYPGMMGGNPGMGHHGMGGHRHP